MKEIFHDSMDQLVFFYIDILLIFKDRESRYKLSANFL